MNALEFSTKLQDNFFSRLNRKTGWGKIEIRQEYLQSVIETMAEMLPPDACDDPSDPLEDEIRDLQQEVDQFREISWERDLTETEAGRLMHISSLLSVKRGTPYNQRRDNHEQEK